MLHISQWTAFPAHSHPMWLTKNLVCQFSSSIMKRFSILHHWTQPSIQTDHFVRCNCPIYLQLEFRDFSSYKNSQEAHRHTSGHQREAESKPYTQDLQTILPYKVVTDSLTQPKAILTSIYAFTYNHTFTQDPCLQTMINYKLTTTCVVSATINDISKWRQFTSVIGK